MLTQEELKKQLHYDPDTGAFTRLIKSARRVKIGDIAGTLTVNGYIAIRVFGRLYKAHRLAFLYMTGNWPKEEIDHINRIRHDNRWCNLREATKEQNQHNSSLRKDNASGYKGVSFKSSLGKWAAYCNSKGRKLHIGYFNSAIEASKARQSATKKLYGEFYMHG